MKKLLLICSFIFCSSHMIAENQNYEKIQNKIKTGVIYGSGFLTATTILSLAHTLGHFIAVRAINPNANDSLQWQGVLNKISPDYTFPKFEKPGLNLLVQIAGPLLGIGLSYYAIKRVKPDEKNKKEKTLFYSGIRAAAYITILTELLSFIPIKNKNLIMFKTPFNSSVYECQLNMTTHGYYIGKDIKEILRAWKQ